MKQEANGDFDGDVVRNKRTAFRINFDSKL